MCFGESYLWWQNERIQYGGQKDNSESCCDTQVEAPKPYVRAGTEGARRKNPWSDGGGGCSKS